MGHADKRQAFWPEKSVRVISRGALEQMQKRGCSLQAEALASGESLAVPLSKAPLCRGREHLSCRDPVTGELAYPPIFTCKSGDVPLTTFAMRLNATTRKGET